METRKAKKQRIERSNAPGFELTRTVQWSTQNGRLLSLSRAMIGHILAFVVGTADDMVALFHTCRVMQLVIAKTLLLALKELEQTEEPLEFSGVPEMTMLEMALAIDKKRICDFDIRKLIIYGGPALGIRAAQHRLWKELQACTKLREIWITEHRRSGPLFPIECFAGFPALRSLTLEMERNEESRPDSLIKFKDTEGWVTYCALPCEVWFEFDYTTILGASSDEFPLDMGRVLGNSCMTKAGSRRIITSIFYAKQSSVHIMSPTGATIGTRLKGRELRVLRSCSGT